MQPDRLPYVREGLRNLMVCELSLGRPGPAQHNLGKGLLRIGALFFRTYNNGTLTGISWMLPHLATHIGGFEHRTFRQ